jgi:hypothetical protein
MYFDNFSKNNLVSSSVRGLILVSNLRQTLDSSQKFIRKYQIWENFCFSKLRYTRVDTGLFDFLSQLSTTIWNDVATREIFYTCRISHGSQQLQRDVSFRSEVIIFYILYNVQTFCSWDTCHLLKVLTIPLLISSIRYDTCHVSWWDVSCPQSSIIFGATRTAQVDTEAGILKKVRLQLLL